jgi:hypothetical protein
MGYYIYLQDYKFCITEDNIPLAHQAVINVFQLQHKYNTPQDFVNMLELNFDWYAGLNEVGDISMITCDGGIKFRDSDVLFETLAPYVNRGSFLEIEDSEGGRWKWGFDGKGMLEHSAHIVYDPFPWEVNNVLSE